MHYLDTSTFASLFVDEARAPDVEAFVDRNPDVAVSLWVEVEFASVLARKYRAGAVDRAGLSAAREAFHAVRSSHVAATLPITDATYLAARDLLADLDALALRSADALHLAIARTSGAVLVTSDRRLADAAEHHGGEVHLIP